MTVNLKRLNLDQIRKEKEEGEKKYSHGDSTSGKSARWDADSSTRVAMLVVGLWQVTFAAQSPLVLPNRIA
jgi:hypothetical protein